MRHRNQRNNSSSNLSWRELFLLSILGIPIFFLIAALAAILVTTSLFKDVYYGI